MNKWMETKFCKCKLKKWSLRNGIKKNELDLLLESVVVLVYGLFGIGCF